MPSKRITRVLVVDDSDTDRALIVAKLHNATFGDFETTEADCFQAAKAALAEASYHVVLLDLRMPDVSEFGGLQALVNAYPDTPIVMLTGVADDELGIEAIRVGAQDFLVKQYYHHGGVIRRILYAIERHRIRREAA